MTFVPFDPLEFKNTKINDAALNALTREIENILSSYVGWFDPFCELIQNALDAVEARALAEKSAGTEDYRPRLDILIDLKQNALTVTSQLDGSLNGLIRFFSASFEGHHYRDKFWVDGLLA